MKNILASIFILVLFTSCGENKKTANVEEQTADTTTQTNNDSDMQNENPGVEYKVRISTSYGDMVVKLYNETPKHRDNFLKLVKEGYYNDLLFHRVMKDFMIQGGDPESKNAKPNTMLGQGGPGYTVPAEFRSNLIHKKGALAAARQSDNVNPAKASSGSQFYIVDGKKYTSQELIQVQNSSGTMLTEEQKKVYGEVDGVPFLDYNYTVFGEVISGLEVIDKIAAVATDPQSNRPKQDVKMTLTIEE